MNKIAIKTIFYILEYLSMSLLTAIILINSNILTGILQGEIKKFFLMLVSVCNDNISFTFTVLLICLAICFISILIIDFMKDDEYTEILKLREEHNNKKINKLHTKYDKVIDKTNVVKDELSKAQKSLHKNTYNAVDNMKLHCLKIEFHYENRKNNYFNTNKNFYDIVKSSRNLDESTLKLIEEFEKDIKEEKT